jgi:hypothetical protein
MRTHESWAFITSQISKTKTKKNKNRIAMHYGIKGMPALTHVGSIHYARGIPWDFMHLLLENVVKNLISLWMGKFKGLDEGIEDYQIPEHIWKLIGKETVDTVKHIPAAFVRSLGNLVDDQTNYTAEGWAFWFMYLGPTLLEGRFAKAKYYNHYCKLVTIMKTCIQYSITHQEINDLEQNIIKWVHEYEKCVDSLN